MARDWSKQRRRFQSQKARAAEIDQARYLGETASLQIQPSKAELRAQAQAAVASYHGPIPKLPTIVNLQCPGCQHRGSVRLPAGRNMARFRCKRCGTTI